MNTLIVLSAILGLSCAIVCPPNYCDGVKQPLLDCRGGVIKNAGFCGCTDICAKVEGEICTVPNLFLGVPNTNICDDGLECTPYTMEGFSGHKCVNKDLLPEASKELTVSRRAPISCMTPCEKKSQLCTFSFVIYEGQWFSKCDDYGNFLPEQCDNTKQCFCVDVKTGEVQEGSKTLGSANC